MLLDESRVVVQNAIYKTAASIKLRPAGLSPLPFLKLFCQVCPADSCLIAAHHFWGPLEETKEEETINVPPAPSCRQNKVSPTPQPFFVSPCD